ncbi:NUDIX hydrolase [Kitasatospora aburaviensis]
MAVPTLAPLAPLLAPADFAATLPPHAVSASVLLTDAAGRILMLHQARGYPGHPAWWQLPGGLGDPGEDPVATARRETAEETGILLTAVLRPLVVDYRCAADGWPPSSTSRSTPVRWRPGERCGSVRSTTPGPGGRTTSGCRTCSRSRGPGSPRSGGPTARPPPCCSPTAGT